MTAHAHHPVHPDSGADLRPAMVPTVAPSVRPRWLLPVTLGPIVVGGLVAEGFLFLSTVLYTGLIGGMLLTHMGGHGHGSHGHGNGEKGGPGSASTNLSKGSSNAQQEMTGSVSGFEPRADDQMMENGNHDHDRHSSSSCH